jgi:hypothetical protein
MTSITARNAAALAERNGTTLPTAKESKGKATPSTAPAPTPNPAPAAPAGVACPCGCGQTANPGRVYRPGHDARHAGQVGRALVANTEGAEAALASLAPALQKKARDFADRQARIAKAKAEAAKIRAQAKADLAAALAAI